jgi:hypothetical protein
VQRDLRSVDLDRANEADGVTGVMTAPMSITLPTKARAISIARRLRLDSRQATTVATPKGYPEDLGRQDDLVRDRLHSKFDRN